MLTRRSWLRIGKIPEWKQLQHQTGNMYCSFVQIDQPLMQIASSGPYRKTCETIKKKSLPRVPKVNFLRRILRGLTWTVPSEDCDLVLSYARSFRQRGEWFSLETSDTESRKWVPDRFVCFFLRNLFFFVEFHPEGNNRHACIRQITVYVCSAAIRDGATPFPMHFLDSGAALSLSRYFMVINNRADITLTLWWTPGTEENGKTGRKRVLKQRSFTGVHEAAHAS